MLPDSWSTIGCNTGVEWQLVKLAPYHLTLLRLWRSPHLHLSGIHRLHQHLRHELLPLSGHRGHGGKTWFEEHLNNQYNLFKDNGILFIKTYSTDIKIAVNLKTPTLT